MTAPYMDYRIKHIPDDYYVNQAVTNLSHLPRCPVCGDYIQPTDIVDGDVNGYDCHKACLELEKEAEDEQT